MTYEQRLVMTAKRLQHLGNSLEANRTAPIEPRHSIVELKQSTGELRAEVGDLQVCLAELQAELEETQVILAQILSGPKQ